MERQISPRFGGLEGHQRKQNSIETLEIKTLEERNSAAIAEEDSGILMANTDKCFNQ